MGKLGIHVQGAVPPWAAKFPVVKVMDTGDVNPAPGRLVVVRRFQVDADAMRLVWRGAAGAIEWLAWMLPWLALRPWIKAAGSPVELPNEPTPIEGNPASWSRDFCQRFDDFTVTATTGLHGAGYKVLGLNWSVGQPDWGRAAWFKRSFAILDYWGPHEYGTKPGLVYTVSQNQIDKPWIGRYQRICDELLTANVRIPPIIIGEFGLDLLLGTPWHPGQGPGGWQDVNNDPAWYAGELAWCMDHIYGPDPRVVGVCVYTAAPYWPWLSYEVTEDLAIRMLAYNAAHPFPEPYPPVPVPTTGVMPGAVDLRRQLPTNGNIPQRKLAQIKRIVIHHSGPPGWLPGVKADAYSRRIAQYHIDKWGWPSIGYAFTVGGNGMICQNLDLEDIGHHVANYNTTSIGVCLIGDFVAGKNVKPTTLQVAAAERVVDWLRAELGPLPVVGHRDLMKTVCPGDTWGKGWKIA